MTVAYLVDTDVLSNARRGALAIKGVQHFFSTAIESKLPLYLSVVTIGELRRGVESLRYRGDKSQATRLETWLQLLLEQYRGNILDFGEDEAQVWGRLRVPHAENAIDKQIAATALTHGLALVTGNVAHFRGLGLDLLNPFTEENEKGSDPFSL